MSETLEQSAKRAWLEVYELRKERDLHKNSALDYLSLWNASVIERDELKCRVDFLETVTAPDSLLDVGAICDQRDSLAAQNVALRSALEALQGNSCGDNADAICADALNPPNLAEEVLKRRDASTLERIVSSCREHHCGLKVAAAIAKER